MLTVVDSRFLKLDGPLTQTLEPGLEHEVDLEFNEKVLKRYRLVESKSSCNVSEIESFTLGPFTSRFWAYRKYINSLSVNQIKQYEPFLAWHCLTLHLSNNKGDIYLVVEDEKVLKKLVALLVFELRTADGRRGTAEQLIQVVKEEL